MFAPQNADMGSNAVAFSGRTTANGRGLLLGNPHYPWQGGRRFWQSQQTIPGELNVSGGSLLGTTAVSIGFNDKVAWSHTVATGVPLSLHQLTLDPADPTAYLVDGERERMTKRTVSVPVKGGAPVTRTQWWTRYGPVVTALGASLPLPWSATTAYALNDPNAANLRGSDTALGFAKARSTRDIQETLRRVQGLPWVNTVAADSAGHSFFSQSQVLPRITDDLAQRCSTPLGKATYPASGVAVLDGSRTDCALGSDKDAVQPGIFGPSKMPVLKDAPYVENSNDSAWLTNADRPLTGYERVFGTVATPRSLRTRGAVEDVSAMAEKGGLTVGDLQRQQFANRAPAGDLAAADAAKACTALAADRPELKDACDVLRRWDRTVNGDSRGALLFDRFWRRLVASVPAAQLWKVPFSPADPVRTPNTLNTAAPGFAAALAHAVEELKAAGIALDAPLGEHQFVVRGGKRVPVHGGTEPLGIWNKIEPVWNAAGGGYTDVTAGSSHIQAVGWDGGRCPVARTLLTYAQTVEPGVTVLQRPDRAVLGRALGDVAVLREGHPQVAGTAGGARARALTPDGVATGPHRCGGGPFRAWGVSRLTGPARTAQFRRSRRIGPERAGTRSGPRRRGAAPPRPPVRPRHPSLHAGFRVRAALVGPVGQVHVVDGDVHLDDLTHPPCPCPSGGRTDARQVRGG